jgi:MFS superfamily sulfate permease-like transporter
MHRTRALLTGLAVGIVSCLYLLLWMRWSIAISGAMSAVVGLAIASVVGTGHADRRDSADAAWEAAAPDLPPHSERVAMEQSQSNIPAPVAPTKSGRRASRAAKPTPVSAVVDAAPAAATSAAAASARKSARRS